MSHAERATAYAQAVIDGDVPACKWVRLAAQRHLDDLDAEGSDDFSYYWDPAAVNRVGQFVELMPHVKGKWARNRERIKLEDWQCFTYLVPFGWKRKSDDLRRYRKSYTEVARKNAKSTATAALGNYAFAADGEHGAEVYSGATSEKQAWEVFGPARLMAKKTTEFQAHYGVEVNAKTLAIPDNASKFEPVIGKPGDGASPSFSITDEYHEHATSEQYDTMVTGMGAREQPMAWVITTAGSSTEGPCYNLRSEVTAMLEGTIPNDELWGVIFTIDEDDDWTTEEAIRKANPNADVSVRLDYLLSQQQEAINNPRKQSTFKTKHLNVWVGAAAPYFNAEKWRRLADAPPLEEFRGEPCWVGLDLGSKLDLTNEIRLFRRTLTDPCPACDGEEDDDCEKCGGGGTVEQDHYYAYVRSYLPEARATDPALQHYMEWAERDALIVTGGDMTDYDTIEADVLADAERFRIVEVGFDPWNATQVVTHLMKAGIPCVEVPQTTSHLSQPMKEVQALIQAGRIHHAGDPVLAWAIGNVTAQEDRNENVFPRKEHKEKKIDPAVALIIAMNRAIQPEDDEPEIVLIGDRTETDDDPDPYYEDELLW